LSLNNFMPSQYQSPSTRTFEIAHVAKRQYAIGNWDFPWFSTLRLSFFVTVGQPPYWIPLIGGFQSKILLWCNNMPQPPNTNIWSIMSFTATWHLVIGDTYHPILPPFRTLKMLKLPATCPPSCHAMLTSYSMWLYQNQYLSTTCPLSKPIILHHTSIWKREKKHIHV